jgi:ribonuclease R
MSELRQRILDAVAQPSYRPLKPKALARLLGISSDRYDHFRQILRELIDTERLRVRKNHTIKATDGHGTAAGVFRRTSTGTGWVRPHVVDGQAGPEIRIREADCLDAVAGDTVLVRIVRRGGHSGSGPRGVVVEVIERATRQFVGTYFERDGEGYVRVDGTVFSHSILVGDATTKGARPEDKVVFEMVRFPGAEERGEGVVIEVLGPRGHPGVDTLSVIRALGLPDEFPEDVKEEARRAAAGFREEVHDREDFTQHVTITIDPVDAKDFDDAVALTLDPRTKHWQLQVHIADVAHFARPGSALDREARKRATSVYLPRRVIPMFPEAISNMVASLQEGKLRYVTSAILDFTPAGVRTGMRFAEGAIRVRKRLSYEQALAQLESWDKRHRDVDHAAAEVNDEVLALLLRMRDLAMILRKRRLKRGALELDMPEPELEYDDQGRVSGAHFRQHDVSHQIIEEFMLAANEAVAEQLASLGVPFLRRIHPSPEPTKLEAFAEFARILGYKMDRHRDRFALQKILRDSSTQAEVHAVHYALLRSMKQAVYSPEEEGHYALASETYCHFTSPIRRYPDLTVHRLLSRWLRSGKAGSDSAELAALGEHCSKMERRAATAERELVKLKLLTYMSERVGTELNAIVTGVADYGFFAQAEHLPVEGLVHVSTLTDDYYSYDEASHSLYGKRTGRRYRLGDKLRVTVVHVDMQRRQLDFRVSSKKAGEAAGSGDQRRAREEPRRARKRRGQETSAKRGSGHKSKRKKKR